MNKYIAPTTEFIEFFHETKYEFSQSQEFRNVKDGEDLLHEFFVFFCNKLLSLRDPETRNEHSRFLLFQGFREFTVIAMKVSKGEQL